MCDIQHKISHGNGPVGPFGQTWNHKPWSNSPTEFLHHWRSTNPTMGTRHCTDSQCFNADKHEASGNAQLQLFCSCWVLDCRSQQDLQPFTPVLPLCIRRTFVEKTSFPVPETKELEIVGAWKRQRYNNIQQWCHRVHRGDQRWRKRSSVSSTAVTWRVGLSKLDLLQTTKSA